MWCLELHCKRAACTTLPSSTGAWRCSVLATRSSLCSCCTLQGGAGTCCARLRSASSSKGQWDRSCAPGQAAVKLHRSSVPSLVNYHVELLFSRTYVTKTPSKTLKMTTQEMGASRQRLSAFVIALLRECLAASALTHSTGSNSSRYHRLMMQPHHVQSRDRLQPPSSPSHTGVKSLASVNVALSRPSVSAYPEL
jgi:hypothetical protein